MKNKTNIIDVIRQAVIDDVIPSHEQIFLLEKAYEKGDCDLLLISICGYPMSILREMVNSKEGQ